MIIKETGTYKITHVCKGGNAGSVWTIPKETEFTVTQIDHEYHKFYSPVFGDWIYWDIDAQKIDELPAKDIIPNPVRYYADGQPYVTIDGVEIINHPVVEKLAEYDRLEKYILPDMQAKLAEFHAKEQPVVHCSECINLCKDDWCSVRGTGLHKNEFCSFGRRKNESYSEDNETPSITPEPLTLEQVRQRNKKPIWVINSDFKISAWGIVNYKKDFFTFEILGVPMCIEANYGKAWLAYDKKK